MGKFRCSCPADLVDIFSHAVPGNVHLPQILEDLLGAGVVMLGDKALQLGGQGLRLPFLEPFSRIL